MGENEYVLFRHGKWAAEKENAKRVSKFFSTKIEALNRAHDIAHRKHGCLVVHNKDNEMTDMICNLLERPKMSDLLKMSIGGEENERK